MTRTSSALLVAIASVGLVTAPVASADALDPIRAAVNGNRSGTACPAYRYEKNLESIAQLAVGISTGPNRYDGAIRKFTGHGDPQAEAINQAYLDGAGPMISNCEFADFGVGFRRDEDSETDYVAIVFGKPPAEPVGPAPVGPSSPPAIDPAPIPVEVKPVVVTNAIQASFADPGALSVDFNVTNTSALTATCNYTATTKSLNPFVPKRTDRTFTVPANSSHTETFDGTATLSTYAVTLSCTDASGAQREELGHVETSLVW